MKNHHALSLYLNILLFFSGNLIDRKIVITRSTEEQRRWLQVLEAQCEKCRRSSLAPVATPSPSPIVKQVAVTQIPPMPKVLFYHVILFTGI